MSKLEKVLTSATYSSKKAKGTRLRKRQEEKKNNTAKKTSLTKFDKFMYYSITFFASMTLFQTDKTWVEALLLAIIILNISITLKYKYSNK